MDYPNFRKCYPMSMAVLASDMVRRMVAREMRGPSDTGPAMQRIEAKYGLPYWTVEHLRKGKAKIVEAEFFQRLRAAYLDHCQRQLVSLKREIELEKARGLDADSDLLAEAEALLAKLEARRP